MSPEVAPIPQNVEETGKKYSPEKLQIVSTALHELRKTLLFFPVFEEEFNKEFLGFNGKLSDKYKVYEYAMIHALRGSSINPNREAEILYEDFPGDDSIEKFVEVLVKKYKKMMYLE